MTSAKACLISLFLFVLIPNSHALEERTAWKKLQVGEANRKYLLHVPANVKKPAPLVLVFHGGGASAPSAEKMGMFSEISDQEGFIVAYPNALYRNWNDGRSQDSSRSHRKQVDDLEFVRALIDEIKANYDVDPERIYATGISNGGIFSHTVGAKLSKRIAAIAPIAGGIAEPFDRTFNPEDPVSVLIVQGTEDPLVRYGGGPVGQKRGSTIPTETAAEMWVNHNHCSAEPIRDELPDRDPEDGCRVERMRWTGGAGGSEVVLLKILGGGHTWPSGKQYLPKKWIGTVCRDIDTGTIWKFFKAHPKKQFDYT